MALCGERSDVLAAPSTCLLDTAVVPLPSFILMLTTVTYAIFRFPRFEPPTSWPAASWWRLALRYAHLFLMVAAFGMSILEIVRLELSRMGSGLLLVQSIAFLYALLLVFRETPDAPRVLFPYWLILAIFESIKVARLTELTQSSPATDTRYPTADWLVDNIVLLVLYVIFILMTAYELYTQRLVARSRKTGSEEA